MSELRSVTLGEVTRNYDAKRVPIKTTERVPGPYSYYGASGIIDKVESYIYDGEYLLVAEDGENLRTRSTPVAFLARGQFWVNNHAHVIKGNDLADTRFLSYLLSITDIGGYLTGSTQPKLTRAAMDAIRIKIPSLTRQRAIAEVLGALDDKIAANTRLAENADTFISLQFEAAMQRSEAMLKPLLEIFKVEFGEAFKGDKFTEPGTGRPLIRIRDLKTFTSQVWTTESRAREVVVYAGDVVVGMDAEFRATAWLGEPGLLNQRVCRVTSKLAGPAFVREALKQPLATIENYKTGTTVIHLNKKDLEETTVLVPDTEALRFFEASTEDLYTARIAWAAGNRTLANIRDALLPQLMSGKLRVKAAEALVAASV